MIRIKIHLVYLISQLQEGGYNFYRGYVYMPRVAHESSRRKRQETRKYIGFNCRNGTSKDRDRLLLLAQ